MMATHENISEMTDRICQAVTVADVLAKRSKDMEQAHVNDLGSMPSKLFSQSLEIAGDLCLEPKPGV